MAIGDPGHRGAAESVRATVGTATHRAPSIVEILEQILLELPPKDIIQAQRINKHVASVIATSSKLQRTLFFTPNLPTVHDQAAAPIRLNPLLSDAAFTSRLPLWYDTMLRYVQYGEELENAQHLMICYAYLEEALEPGSGLPREQATVVIRENTNETAKPEYPREGTWQKMYLTQPVCHIKARLTADDCLYERTFEEYELSSVCTIGSKLCQGEGTGTLTTKYEAFMGLQRASTDED